MVHLCDFPPGFDFSTPRPVFHKDDPVLIGPSLTYPHRIGKQCFLSQRLINPGAFAHPSRYQVVPTTLNSRDTFVYLGFHPQTARGLVANLHYAERLANDDYCDSNKVKVYSALDLAVEEAVDRYVAMLRTVDGNDHDPIDPSTQQYASQLWRRQTLRAVDDTYSRSQLQILHDGVYYSRDGQAFDPWKDIPYYVVADIKANLLPKWELLLRLRDESTARAAGVEAATVPDLRLEEYPSAEGGIGCGWETLHREGADPVENESLTFGALPCGDEADNSSDDTWDKI